ncbi:ABC transporter permease [Salmonella enterica]|nr:ABC transporter permease [Salmonella enterica]ECX6013049.1 ABC transporter permease [Salmonella enterica subsp. enterica serovar Rubislaw]EEJ9528661.1 ABC transporter permease [Salmonella enterica subsp. enterica serovar Rubislaw]
MRIVALLMIALIICGPYLIPYNPQRSLGLAWQLPDKTLWLGSDGLGRDVLSRLLSGGRNILLFPLLCTLCSSFLGSLCALLLVAVPDRGRRLVVLLDPLLYMPPLLVLIGVIYAFGNGQVALLIGMTLLNIPFTLRYVRSLADPVLDTGYVEVACAAGDALPLLLWREVLPVIVPGILADGTTRLVAAIYLLASASFLGIATPGGIDWASMVRDGLPGLMLNPWAALLPALGIALVVVAISLQTDRWSRS